MKTSERTALDYKNLSSKFSEHPQNYNRQYCSIYRARLRDMKPLLLSRIEEKWGKRYPICDIHKLAEKKNEKCIVIGTLFKDQKLKPSILRQLAESNQLTPQPILSHCTDDSDLLYIEDELQRYQVLGSLKGNNLVTGITCALLGSCFEEGKFDVTDYLFADYRPQVPRPVQIKDVFVIFISGVDFIHHEKFLPKLQLLVNSINGLLGNVEQASKIARIIFAGNSTKNTPEPTKPTISLTSRIGVSTQSIEAVKSFDYFLSQLCQYIDVDVMPGEHDPSNHILPQKQMHFYLFPRSTCIKSSNLVPNPYFCSLNGVKILGTSGQPVLNVMKYSDTQDPLQVMEDCLRWNHLAPTAPDTLGCFPYYDRDPFILDDCPHVFFAGNQSKFGTKTVKGENGQEVLLLSIPQFANTFEVACLNLNTFECSPLTFNA